MKKKMNNLCVKNAVTAKSATDGVHLKFRSSHRDV